MKIAGDHLPSNLEITNTKKAIMDNDTCLIRRADKELMGVSIDILPIDRFKKNQNC